MCRLRIQELKIGNWEDFEKIEFFSLSLMRKRLSSGQKGFWGQDSYGAVAGGYEVVTGWLRGGYGVVMGWLWGGINYGVHRAKKLARGATN